MHNKKKRVLMVPFGVVAGLLLVASVAYACTSWIGQFKVTGNGTHTPTASDTVTVNGKGTRTSFTMTQCVDSPIAKSTHSSGSITIWTGTSPDQFCSTTSRDAADRRLPECGSRGSGDLTCTGTPPTNKRVYDVNFYNSVYRLLDADTPGYWNHTTANLDFGNSGDCMSGFLEDSVKLGTVTVDSNGEIDNATVGALGGNGYSSTTRTAHFNLPGSLTHDESPMESAVCVSDGAAYYGNQAPLTIV